MAENEKKAYFTEIGDILEQHADAIVVPVNRIPVVGTGRSLDKLVFEKAGEELLNARMEACKSTGGIIEYGKAIITEAFGLRDHFKYIIMTATPFNEKGAAALATPRSNLLRVLGECYQSSVQCAKQQADKMRNTKEPQKISVIFPLLGAGANGVPPIIALQVAEHFFNQLSQEDQNAVNIKTILKEELQEEDYNKKPEVKNEINKKVYMLIAEKQYAEATIEALLGKKRAEKETYTMSTDEQSGGKTVVRHINAKDNQMKNSEREQLDKILEKQIRQLLKEEENTDQKKENPIKKIFETYAEKGWKTEVANKMNIGRSQVSRYFSINGMPQEGLRGYLVMAYFAKLPWVAFEEIAASKPFYRAFPTSMWEGLLAWYIDNQPDESLEKLNEDFGRYFVKEKFFYRECKKEQSASEKEQSKGQKKSAKQGQAGADKTSKPRETEA
jgi:O-acetyl-ADP-ribose deacetylase (regulator of RNase III)